MEEDWQVIRDIMDYRMLVSAKNQHNDDASKMSEGQMKIWAEMAEAVEDDG